MSNNNRRKAIVERIRTEGAAAFEAGRSIHTNPYRDMDEYQWRNGWLDAKRAATLAQENEEI